MDAERLRREAETCREARAELFRHMHRSGELANVYRVIHHVVMNSGRSLHDAPWWMPWADRRFGILVSAAAIVVYNPGMLSDSEVHALRRVCDCELPGEPGHLDRATIERRAAMLCGDAMSEDLVG